MKTAPLQRIAHALQEAGQAPEDALLVGFSGGRDSVALVHWLREAGFRALTLLHLDHGLRPESAQDAAWCAQFALALGLPLVTERADVAALAETRRIGIEEAAREARYAFFERTAEAMATPRIALAHHADDQAETFLFRLLRGSGAGGLGGMSPVSVRSAGSAPLTVLRPMLGVWRGEIDAFLSSRGIAFREDPTNTDPRWTRNRLRHELLPTLSRVMQRPVNEALWRAAEMLREESALLEEIEKAGGALGADLDVAALRELPVALQRRRIARWLHAGGVAGVGFETVECVRGLLQRRTPAKTNLPGGMHARRKAGKIFLQHPPRTGQNGPPA